MSKNRLKELRLSRGWTIEETAEKLHIAKSTYAGYEYGRRDVPNETLSRIANFYHVSVDYVIGHEPDWQTIDEVVPDPAIAEQMKSVGATAIMLTDKLIKSGMTHEQLEQLLQMMLELRKTQAE